MFGKTFKISCSLSWIQGPAPEDGRPPLPLKSFSTPTRTRAFSGLCVLIGIVQLLSHVWLSDYMFGNKIGFPVFHYFAVSSNSCLWVGDAISQSHPFIPSPSAHNLSQHQGHFQWAGSSHHWPKCWSFIFSISSSIEYYSTTSKTKLMFPNTWQFWTLIKFSRTGI